MKKLILAAALAVGALAANAGAVNWGSTSNKYFHWFVESSDNVFEYAKLACFVEAGEHVYLTVGDTGATAVSAAAGNLTTESVFSNLGTHDDVYWGDYSFIVEAYDATGTLVGQSETLALGDIVGAVYEYEGMQFIGGGVTPMGITVGAIPEPTSGLLLLLGVGGLALRRRGA